VKFDYHKNIFVVWKSLLKNDIRLIINVKGNNNKIDWNEDLELWEDVTLPIANINQLAT
jgi:hypothetical protein